MNVNDLVDRVVKIILAESVNRGFQLW